MSIWTERLVTSMKTGLKLLSPSVSLKRSERDGSMDGSYRRLVGNTLHLTLLGITASHSRYRAITKSTQELTSVVAVRVGTLQLWRFWLYRRTTGKGTSTKVVVWMVYRQLLAIRL